jgi:hypothetical protein
MDTCNKNTKGKVKMSHKGNTGKCADNFPGNFDFN